MEGVGVLDIFFFLLHGQIIHTYVNMCGLLRSRYRLLEEKCKYLGRNNIVFSAIVCIFMSIKN